VGAGGSASKQKTDTAPACRWCSLAHQPAPSKTVWGHGIRLWLAHLEFQHTLLLLEQLLRTVTQLHNLVSLRRHTRHTPGRGSSTQALNPRGMVCLCACMCSAVVHLQPHASGQQYAAKQIGAQTQLTRPLNINLCCGLVRPDTTHKTPQHQPLLWTCATNSIKLPHVIYTEQKQ
jgi:hypothetical protein